MRSKRDIKRILLLIIILGIIYLNFYPTNPYNMNNINLKLGINSDNKNFLYYYLIYPFLPFLSKKVY